MTEKVTIAVIGANHTPLLFKTLQSQTWKKSDTYLFFTNPESKELIKWIVDNKIVLESDKKEKEGEYAGVYISTDADKNNAVKYARKKESALLIIDTGNYITPKTVESLMLTNLPVVTPLLRQTGKLYSNYHYFVDSNGYYLESPEYYWIFDQKVKGLIEVQAINHVVLYRTSAVSLLSFSDKSGRPEYIAASACMRKFKIPQYIDNRHVYGYMSSGIDVTKETWYSEL